MKFLIVVLAIISVCVAQSDEDWEGFQSKFGKSYRSVEDVSNRRAIWEKNWNKIKDHNKRFAQGQYNYTLGENQFADLTYEEFSQTYLGFDAKSPAGKVEEHQMSGRAIASSVDFRKNGWVRHVRDQGQCGGCWAFACAAAVEIALIRSGVALTDHLSPQFLIQCSKGLLLGIIQRNKGCSGGQLESTYDDMKNIGNQYESDWPYKGVDGSCPSGYSKRLFVKGKVAVKTEQAILDAVHAGHPVSIGMHASATFQLYKSGIYHGTAEENKAGLNHAITIVGYKIDSRGEEHYIIRNSWAPSWGEDGYVRLRHGDNHLGITGMASYPTV